MTVEDGSMNLEDMKAVINKRLAMMQVEAQSVDLAQLQPGIAFLDYGHIQLIANFCQILLKDLEKLHET